MATIERATASAPQSAPQFVRPKTLGEIRVTTYDRFSGLLITLLLFVGFVVAMLVIVWITSQNWRFDRIVAVDISEPEPGGGGQGAALANLEEPLEEEIEVVEPVLEVVFEAITDAITTQVAVLDQMQPKRFTGRGDGQGTGDGRGVGPGGPGDKDVIPRWERWEIRYASNSVSAYKAQLDFFKIELGAVGGEKFGQNVEYAIGFGSGRPTKRTGPAKDEKRLYMTWKGGDLKKSDESLLNQAGISTKGRIMMQLYSKEIEDLLATLERQYAGKDRDIRSIRRTIFEVRSSGSGYEYFVKDQMYRNFVK